MPGCWNTQREKQLEEYQELCTTNLDLIRIFIIAFEAPNQNQSIFTGLCQYKKNNDLKPDEVPTYSDRMSQKKS
jgi:hypothetical protein